MTATHRFLVGFDDTDGAHGALAWAAGHTGAADDILVATVAEPGGAAPRRLREALAGLAGDPVPAACAWMPIVLEGRMTAETLVRTAHERGADAIVVGSHRDCPDPGLAPSVSHRLVEVSDLPIVIVPTHDGAGQR